MNEKKRKEKFLEHYFAVCIEHGYCIDWHGEKAELFISDAVQYKHIWDEIRAELEGSIE